MARNNIAEAGFRPLNCFIQAAHHENFCLWNFDRRHLICTAALLPSTAVHAQLGNVLKQGERAASSRGQGALGSMGGALSGQSLSSGSVGNVAGLLDFCIKSNFLGSDGAASVKDKLMGKLTGESPSSDNGYKEGAKGILSNSDGKQLDLSGGGMKAEAARQICDKVLAQGKFM